MKEKYIDECKAIQQNCTYTAEAHHQMALSAKNKGTWLEIVPAVAAALSATLVAAGLASTQILPFTIVTSVISAVAAVLNPNKTYQEHLSAARNFTALKHDARFLHEAMVHKMADDAFTISVENLHQKYNELLKAVPPTSSESFAKAQEVVQKGTHDFDKDKKGQIK